LFFLRHSVHLLSALCINCLLNKMMSMLYFLTTQTTFQASFIISKWLCTAPRSWPAECSRHPWRCSELLMLPCLLQRLLCPEYCLPSWTHKHTTTVRTPHCVPIENNPFSFWSELMWMQIHYQSSFTDRFSRKLSPAHAHDDSPQLVSLLPALT